MSDLSVVPLSGTPSLTDFEQPMRTNAIVMTDATTGSTNDEKHEINTKIHDDFFTGAVRFAGQ